MKIYKLNLVLILLTISLQGFSQLIFNSGFEPNSTHINPLDPNYSDIIGVDSSCPAPNDWVGDLDQNPDIGSFRIQYSGGDVSERFVDLVQDPTDSTNTVMRYWLKHANDPIGNSGLYKGRIQAMLSGCTNLHNFSQSVRLYLSEDWKIIKNTNDFTMNWMTIMEFWNDGYWIGSPFPFRASLGIIKDDSTGTDLTFKVHFDTMQVSIHKWETMYIEKDTSFSIPTEKWMTLEYYYEEGDENTGRFIFTVTPEGEPRQIIFNITTYTRHPLDTTPNGLHALSPMKMYTHTRNIDTVRSNGGVLQMYWDDFKFWKDTNILCENLIDVTTTINSGTITANQAGATYQWIDCNSGLSIAGAIDSNYTATANGDYAVIITMNNCSDTSDCVTIASVGIDENVFGTDIFLYPNPTTDLITVELGELKGAQITVIDLLGRVVYSDTKSTSQTLAISMNNFAKGTYLLNITKENNRRVFYVMKQ